MSLSENKNEENLLATSTGVKEYADAIRSWKGQELKPRHEEFFYEWTYKHVAFDLKNRCDDKIDQKVEVCREKRLLGHARGKTFYKRNSGKFQTVSP